MRKLVRNLTKSVFKQMPQATQEYFFSKLITIPTNIHNDIVIKVADSTDELRQSYKLLHDAYVEQGFIDKDETGMRVLLQYTLPTTTTIVVKNKAEVVGTLTIVKSNILGFPMEQHFNLNYLKDKYPVELAEITGLAIKKNNRRENGGNVLFPMLKFMYEYCRDFYHIKTLAIVIHPKDIPFYKGLMFFQEIPENKIIHYMNAPAVSMFLDLDFALLKFKEIYSNREASKNLFNFFVERTFQNLKYPERAKELSFDSAINRQMVENFFSKECKVFDRASLLDLKKLRTVYYATELNKYFETLLGELPFYPDNQRMAVNILAVIRGEKEVIRITDVSLSGLSAIGECQLSLESICDLSFKLPNQKQVNLKVQVKNFQNGQYGMKIIDNNNDYQQYIMKICFAPTVFKKAS